MGISQDDNLKLYLPMNEGSGTTCNDYSGEGNNGTINGASWDTKKNRNNVLDFDGTGDYVSLPTSLSIDGNNWSLSLWFKTNGSGASDESLFGGDGDSSADWFRFKFDNSQNLILQVDDGSNPLCYIDAGTGYDNSQWNHAVITKVGSGGAFKLYINDVLKGTDTNVDGAIHLNTEINIGKWRASVPEYFNGIISDVQIFNKALSQEQITHIYKTTYRE